ncbi:MAG TPA: IS701 family transposase [Ktedonobacteraceae bacterium]|nr:IS701 family transposase [Ktedonobacteraceae bacterium]
MKQDKHTTLTGSRTTSAEVCRWAQELFSLHARIAQRFARPEPRRRALAYLQGILSDTARKNGWQLAEHAGEARPDGMQRLLSQAVWDTDGVQDDLRAYALEQLGTESAVLVIDESGFPKRGHKSAGVAMQYCGSSGQVENCQVGVFLSYVTARGHCLIDRELYLPADWFDDPARCRQAHIPEEVRFQTKPELARSMVERLLQASVSLEWVVADCVYGSNLDLRTFLQAHELAYVLAVPKSEPVEFLAATGRRREEAALVESFLNEPPTWQRLSMSQGTKGPRLFDWTAIPMLERFQDDGRHFLLIRRDLADPHEKRYYFVFAPLGTTLSEMVQAIGARWHVEEDFENGKDMGLDHYEVRSFIGWYRHITLVMLAAAYLVGICAQAHVSCPVAVLSMPVLLPLTVAEVRHLLARLIWPASSSVRRVLTWSWWRRVHQSWASYYHTKRRLKAG